MQFKTDKVVSAVSDTDVKINIGVENAMITKTSMDSISSSILQDVEVSLQVKDIMKRQETSFKIIEETAYKLEDLYYPLTRTPCNGLYLISWKQIGENYGIKNYKTSFIRLRCFEKNAVLL